MGAEAGLPVRPFPIGARGLLLVAIVAAAVWAAASLGLFGSGPEISSGGLEQAGRFLSRALSPSLVSEAPPPFGGESILPNVLDAVLATIRFAAAAFGIAVVAGFLLAVLGSTSWWAGDPAGGAGPASRFLRRTVAPVVYGVTRVVIAVTRSIHELLWAVLLLSAFGRSDLVAILAIAIPFSGIVAKVYSEIFDEAPRDAADAIRAGGAGPISAFAFGILPRALPDMAAWSFFQFECALRSSAVLGFFGFPTLGYAIRTSFENLQYGEVWTYLYSLCLLILVTEWWSGAFRRRLTG